MLTSIHNSVNLNQSENVVYNPEGNIGGLEVQRHFCFTFLGGKIVLRSVISKLLLCVIWQLLVNLKRFKKVFPK